MIDKDTQLFCSFASQAGSFGCKFHNAAFRELGINALYKSFSVTSIQNAILSMETLGIKGAAISIPYKKEVLNYVQQKTKEVESISAANTITLDSGIFTAHNTDWLAARELLSRTDKNCKLYILGNGGFSRAVQYAATDLKFRFEILDYRKIISMPIFYAPTDIHKSIIFNCTPVSCIRWHCETFIDCIVGTPTGNELAFWSAYYQFQLYTGKKIPWTYEEYKQKSL